MPPIARTYVKTAFIYFVVAFVLDALMMLDRWVPFSRWLGMLYLSQLHLLLVGWVTQLAIGVAYWIFPRFLKTQSPDPRGPDWLAWGVFVSLNAGLLLRFVCEPLTPMSSQSWLPALVALSGVLQAAAAVGFGLLIWGRIRAMET